MTPKRIAELTAIYRDGLLKDTVPFWTKHAVDRKYGGFTTYVDADGSLVSTDKAIWVQGRFTWLLARLYNEVEKRPEWLRLSRHGVEFILKHAFDTDGRCFYSVTRDGRPLRKRRYLFSETFIIIALAEYALASGDGEIRRKAVELYRRLIMYYRTPGLLPPKVLPQTRQWKGHSMPMILLATTQVLRRVDDHPLYKEVVDQSIREILNDFVDPKRQVLLETVGPNGEKRYDLPEGRLANPGHAIETAWFLMEEGRYRNDRKLIEQGAQITEWSLDLGWDRKFGGISYFVDIEGKPAEPYEHDMKLWWPHNEAIYGTLLAHHLTGRKSFETWHRRVHDWAYSHFPDRKNGEWFGYLHRDGTISSPIKGNMWKGPFHLPRMQLYCWKLLEEMGRKGGGR